MGKGGIGIIYFSEGKTVGLGLGLDSWANTHKNTLDTAPVHHKGVRIQRCEVQQVKQLDLLYKCDEQLQANSSGSVI